MKPAAKQQMKIYDSRREWMEWTRFYNSIFGASSSRFVWRYTPKSMSYLHSLNCRNLMADVAKIFFFSFFPSSTFINNSMELRLSKWWTMKFHFYTTASSGALTKRRKFFEICHICVVVNFANPQETSLPQWFFISGHWFRLRKFYLQRFENS